MRSITRAHATPDRLEAVVDANLSALEVLLDYNERNDVRLFRIGSGVIPFGSSPVNTIDWQTGFAERLAALGEKARRAGIRLCMHPGQYTVLDSPDENVVARAVDDLAYHAAFLDALGMDASHKIVLHVGGAYGYKEAALLRFERAHAILPRNVQARLVVENDDRLFTALDVLRLSARTGAPFVFDVLHHELNRESDAPDALELVDAAHGTWRDGDGPQKIHYAQQAPGKRPGSHSGTIAVAPFLAFHQRLAARRAGSGVAMPDIMLEVKDKNVSALKCIACTDEHGSIGALEREWARYKYSVLEHDQAVYRQIRELLNDKRGYPAVAFYELTERALREPSDRGSFRNAAQHVWGYVSDQASERERASFASLEERFDRGEASSAAVKARLRSLAEKYGQDYLLESYYFDL